MILSVLINDVLYHKSCFLLWNDYLLYFSIASIWVLKWCLNSWNTQHFLHFKSNACMEHNAYCWLMWGFVENVGNYTVLFSTKDIQLWRLQGVVAKEHAKSSVKLPCVNKINKICMYGCFSMCWFLDDGNPTYVGYVHYSKKDIDFIGLSNKMWARRKQCRTK